MVSGTSTALPTERKISAACSLWMSSACVPGAVRARAHAHLRGRVGHGAHDGNRVFEVRFDLGEGNARRNADEQGQRLAAVALEGVRDLVQHRRHLVGLDGQKDDVGVFGDLHVVVGHFDAERGCRFWTGRGARR